MSESTLFLAKKWALLLFGAIFIIELIIYTAMAGTWVTKAQGENSDGRTGAIVLIVITNILVIIFQLVGLFAAVQEHFFTSSAFSVLNLLGTIWFVIRSFASLAAYWGLAVPSLILSILSASFTYDLYKMN